MGITWYIQKLDIKGHLKLQLDSNIKTTYVVGFSPTQPEIRSIELLIWDDNDEEDDDDDDDDDQTDNATGDDGVHDRHEMGIKDELEAQSQSQSQ